MRIRSVRNVITLKPEHQAKALIEALAAVNISAYNFATIAIEPARDQQAIKAIAQTISNVDIAIFTSTNAVPPAIDSWPDAQTPKYVFAIGPATAKALSERGIGVEQLPQHPSSEGLLTLPALSADAVTDKRVVIFTGEQAKPLLRKTLSQRHAKVIEIACYRRRCTQPKSSDIEQLTQQPSEVIVATSLETLINLFQIILPQHLKWLLSKRLLVISPSMQRFAMQAGFLKQRILVADNASQAAIIKALTNSG